MFLQVLVYVLLAFSQVGVQERRLVTVPEDARDEVEEPTVSVELSFDVQHGPYKNPSPAPGIVVEFGVGKKKGYGPLYLAAPVLATFTSDEDGLIRATIEIPESWRKDKDAWLWARVATPGYTRRTMLRSIRSGANDEATALTLYEGGTLTGSVIDDDGAPVAASTVRLYLRDGRGITPRNSTKTDVEGRFALHFGVDGTYEVLARADGRGSGHVGPISLRLAAWPPPVTIAIGGGVAAHGRVLDPAGAPVPGLTVTAVPAEGYPDEKQRFEREGAGGLTLDRTRTDRDGRFWFPALVRGRYTVFGSYLSDEEYTGRTRRDRIGERMGRITTSDESRDFVHDGYRLEVTVVDHAGASIDPSAATLKSRDDRPTAGPLLDVTDQTSWWLKGWPIQLEELVIYPVQPDHEYVVSWEDSTVPYAEVHARVDWGRHRIPVLLQLGQDTEFARLTLRIVDPSGYDFADPMVAVTSAATGRELAMTHIQRGSWGRSGGMASLDGANCTASVPPGDYRIEVNSSPTIGCLIPTPFPREPHLATFVDIELASAEELAIVVELGAAGHLDFEALEPKPDLTRAERDRLVPNHYIDEAVIDAARRRHGGVGVTLISKSGDRLRLSRFETPRLSSRLSFDGVDWIVRGRGARGLEAVPVGDWILRLERGGELLLERSILIEAGRVTTVRW